MSRRVRSFLRRPCLSLKNPCTGPIGDSRFSASSENSAEGLGYFFFVCEGSVPTYPRYASAIYLQTGFGTFHLVELLEQPELCVPNRLQLWGCVTDDDSDSDGDDDDSGDKDDGGAAARATTKAKTAATMTTMTTTNAGIPHVHSRYIAYRIYPTAKVSGVHDSIVLESFISRTTYVCVSRARVPYARDSVIAHFPRVPALTSLESRQVRQAVSAGCLSGILAV